MFDNTVCCTNRKKEGNPLKWYFTPQMTLSLLLNDEIELLLQLTSVVLEICLAAPCFSLWIKNWKHWYCLLGRRCRWCYCLGIRWNSACSRFPPPNWKRGQCGDIEEYPSFISGIEVSGDLGVEGTNVSRCTLSIQKTKTRVDKGLLREWRPEEHGKVLKSGNAEKKSRRLLLVWCPHTPWLCPIVSGRRCWPSPIGWCAILLYEDVSSV